MKFVMEEGQCYIVLDEQQARDYARLVEWHFLSTLTLRAKRLNRANIRRGRPGVPSRPLYE